MNRIKLENLLDAHRISFQRLAKIWMDFGATAFFVTDPENRTLFQSSPGLVETTEFSAPLITRGKQLGALHVAGTAIGSPNGSNANRLTADAQILSDLLLLEYELQRMTADIIDHQDQLMALHQLARSSRVDQDLRTTMADLAKTTAQVIKTEYAFIVLQQQQAGTLCEMYPPQRWSDALWANVLEIAAGDQTTQDWILQEQDGLCMQCLAPLCNLVMKRMPVRENISLLLGAANKIDGTFQAPDLKLFHIIAGPAVATIENGILHQEMLDQARIQTEMDLARQVQMRLLPQQTPVIEGIDLAAMTKPASQVGGDFFDFVDNGSNLLTFTLGDVSGKGMPAALLMAMLRTVLRDQARSLNDAKPEVILEKTNRALYQDFSDVDMFATVFLGQYNYRSHTLYFANDGHAPVIFRPVGGKARLLAADAPPLGVLDFHLAERHTLTLQPGDLLVVATDGFSEAERSDGQMLGYERFMEMVDEFADADCATIAKQLFEQVAHFADGCPQADDQTILVLKRTMYHAQGSNDEVSNS